MPNRSAIWSCALLVACAASGPSFELEVSIPPIEEHLGTIIEEQMDALGYQLDEVTPRSTSSTRKFLKVRPGPERGSLIHDRIEVTVMYQRIVTQPRDLRSSRGYVIHIRAQTFEELRRVERVQPSRTVIEDATAFAEAFKEVARRHGVVGGGSGDGGEGAGTRGLPAAASVDVQVHRD